MVICAKIAGPGGFHLDRFLLLVLGRIGIKCVSTWILEFIDSQFSSYA